MDLLSEATRDKFFLMKQHLLVLDKKLNEITNTFEQVSQRSQQLEETLKEEEKILRRDSYVLYLMEIFLRHPGLAHIVASFVSNFFQLLLHHVQTECPDEGPFHCVRQIWNRERKSKPIQNSFGRFCSSYSITSNMISILNEIHSCFCNSGQWSLTRKQATAIMSTKRVLDIIEKELSESDSMVAAALKRAIMATTRSTILKNGETEKHV